MPSTTYYSMIIETVVSIYTTIMSPAIWMFPPTEYSLEKGMVCMENFFQVFFSIKKNVLFD